MSTKPTKTIAHIRAEDSTQLRGAIARLGLGLPLERAVSVVLLEGKDNTFALRIVTNKEAAL